MLKITFEDDTGILGYKDKNAWTIEDFLKMATKIAVVAFDLDENTKIVLEKFYPNAKEDTIAETEGM